MGFSLSSILKQGEAQINPFDHGKTAATVKQAQAKQAIAQLPSPGQPRQMAAPQNFMQRATNDFANVSHAVSHLTPGGMLINHFAPKIQQVAAHAPQAINNHFANSSKPVKAVAHFATDNLVKPLTTVTQHSAQITQGHNPYHGTNKQILGQVGTDVLNAAATIPVGKAAKGAVVAEKSVPLAVRAAKGALMGAGSGAAIGGGLGATGAMEQNANTHDIIKSALINAGVGGAMGGVLGGAAPLVRPGLEKGVQTTRDIATNKPHRNVSTDELAAVKRVAMSRAGYGDEVSNMHPNDVQVYRQVQKKLGTKNVNDHSAIDDLIGSRMTYDTKMSQMPGILQGQGGFIGENPHITPVDETPNMQPQQLPGEAQAPQIAQHPGEASGSPQLTPMPERISRTNRAGIREAVNQRPLTAEEIASLPANRTTTVGLNTDRLNTSDVAKQHLGDETANIIEKMSNEDVQKIAKSAGLDTRTYDVQQTRQKIAEQLNVRQDAVRLQHEAEAARQSGDTQRAALLLKQSAEMGRTSRNQGTDLARQLQARRIIANELDTPQQRIFKLLDNAGVNPDVYTERLANVDFTNTQEVVKAYRDLVPAKFGDWLDKYRYTNMLSSPMTQARNIFGNLQGGAMVRPTQKVFEGGLDAIHSIATGKERTRFAGEAGAYAKGYAKAVPDALRAFGDAMTGKSAQSNPDMGDLAHSPLAVGGVKGAADKVLSFIPKLMEAFDEASQANIRGGETRALNYRESKGIKVNDIPGKAQEAADYTLFRQDLNNGREGHLLGALDFIPQKVQEARGNSNPVIRNASKLIFPFVKTPTNISKQMIEYSPLGVLTLPGHADKTGQLAKAIMGTSLTATAAGYLAANNKLTFATPTDAKEKQKFLAQGRQPYSVKIGNKWVSYQYLHPAISFQLAATASVNDALRNGKVDDSTATKIMEGLASTSRFFVDQSYFKNAQDFLNNASGTGSFGKQGLTAVASQASNTVNQFVPFRAAATWINNFIDQTQRQPDSSANAAEQFKQQFESQLPWLSKNVPARTDNLGNDLKKPAPVLNNFSPVKISTEKNDNTTSGNKLQDEVDRLSRQDNSIALTKQTSSQKAFEDGTKLNGKQLDSMTKQVNSKVEDYWGKLIKTPDYQKLSDEDKRHALSTLKTDVTAGEKRNWAAENNVALKKQANKTESAYIDGKLDVAKYTKAKGSDGSYAQSTTTPIAKNIDKSSQTTLKAYDAMSKTERYNATARQPDFEYNHLKAKYENDKANNKLNAKTDIAAQKALAKAAVGKDYSHEVRDLYTLNKSDLYTYLSTPEKGKDKQKIASDILAYDKALKDAGIIAYTKLHDKNGRVTLTAKNSSGTYGKKTGGGGGKGPSNASIASSVTRYSGSNNALKYQKSLRDIALRASMGKHSTSTKSSSSKAKLKSYKVASGTTSLKPKKAFA